MALPSSISFTELSTNTAFSVNEENLIFATDATIGSDITFINAPTNSLIQKTVTEDLTAILALSNLMLQVTLADGTTPLFNVSRVEETVFNSTGANFLYNKEGAMSYPHQTSMTETAFLTLIYEKEGKSVYAFNDVSATLDTISLVPAAGDLTSTFVSGKYFTVFGNTVANGTYKTTSSALVGGRTIITVDTTVKAVPAGAAETGAIYIL